MRARLDEGYVNKLLTRIDFGSLLIAAVLIYGYGKLALIAAGVL